MHVHALKQVDKIREKLIFNQKLAKKNQWFLDELNTHMVKNSSALEMMVNWRVD